MKKSPEIKRLNGNVIVLNVKGVKGVKVFDMPHNEQTVAVAHGIYMHEKYSDRLVKQEDVS